MSIRFVPRFNRHASISSSPILCKSPNGPRYSFDPGESMLRMSALGIVSTVLMTALGVQAQEDYATWPSYKNVIVNTKAGGAAISANVFEYPLLVRLDSTSPDIFLQG